MCQDNVYSTEQLKTYYSSLKKIENRLYAALVEIQEKKTNILMHRGINMRDIPIQCNRANVDTIAISLNKLAFFIDGDVHQGQKIDVCIKRIGSSIDSMVGECCDLVDAISEVYKIPCVNHKRIKEVIVSKNNCLKNSLESDGNHDAFLVRLNDTINNIRSLLVTYNDTMNCLKRVVF